MRIEKRNKGKRSGSRLVMGEIKVKELLKKREYQTICTALTNLDDNYFKLKNQIEANKNSEQIEDILSRKDLAIGSMGDMIERLKELFECEIE